MSKTITECKVGQNTICLETGVMAKQADGAVVAKCGNNIVLATVVSSKQPSSFDFFPLTVEYQERLYASGKIPGGYFKREGRPTELNTLNCRLIDRPLRPLFPEGYNHETQIITSVLSFDGLFPVHILAGIASSTALHISDIPFHGPACSIQLARVNKEFIVNPDSKQIEESDMNMVIAGTTKGLLMVEGESQFLTENEILEALKFAHQSFLPLIEAQEDLRSKVGHTKRDFTPVSIDPSIREKLEQKFKSQIVTGLKIKTKQERYAHLADLQVEATENITEEILDESATEQEKEATQQTVQTVYNQLKYEIVRNMILNEGVRIDGRNSTDVRPIECEVGVLPRTHGSGLFTRGETQVLGTITLGTSDDAQSIDTLYGPLSKRFLLHYNFPPFCVGETGRVGGRSRREIGHGFLAERALSAILPQEETFPYIIRLVGEVLESNGSSSMGTVCSGMLALLDAGVPVQKNVAGIAMGLIKEGEQVAILSDILGDEDHLGDMDFKVAGARDGITALQMDIKIDNIDFDTIEKALMQAKQGRNEILDKMEQVISQPRADLSPFAPRIETIKINPDKVRDVIGPNGRTIKDIIATTGVKIDIMDDGTINVVSLEPETRQQALDMIKNIIADPEVGKVYKGTVVKIADFGAFVEILSNTTGLLHISEIARERVTNVSDYLKEGDQIDVKVLDMDRTGRIKLSRKVLL